MSRPHHRLHVALCAMLILAFTACASSPLGRRQLKLYPESEMDAVGIASFRKIVTESAISRNRTLNYYVRCVADQITAQLRGKDGIRRWEVVVFDDPAANAFALPGGKIGVNTGMLEIAENQDQLAAVIGHEVAHVVADHANERMSTQLATHAGVGLAQTMAGAASPLQREALGLLGVGAQYGIVLPYSRTHEKEADLYGLDLMAEAGFDPREALTLWENMSKANGTQPPEMLSTHPSNETRIEAIKERLPSAIRIRAESNAEGRQPRCG